MEPSDARTLAHDWLKDLCLALKNVGLYSVEHPRGREYVDRAYESLRRVLGGRPEVTLVRHERRLQLDRILLDRDRSLAQQLAEDLEARGIESLVLQASMTPEEHLGLIRCLLARPERVQEKGGFADLLLDEGVAAVRVPEPPAPGAVPHGAEGPALERRLVDYLVQVTRGPARTTEGPAAAAGAAGAGGETATGLLGHDPEALGDALSALSRSRAGAQGGPEAMAEVVADALERLAERAVEEHQKDRNEILADVGRAAVRSDPDLHHPLFLEKGGPRSIRRNLVDAVEALPADAVGELVAVHHPRAAGDYTRLTEMLGRTLVWREDREAALTEVKKALLESGADEETYRDLVDHLVWGEVSVARRLELLAKGDLLWRVDFARVKEVLVKLFAGDQVKDATTLVQKYLSGLLSEDLEIRRRVADNARYLLHLIEKTGKGQPMLGRIADMFFTRLQDETDADVVSRLAGGLAFLADLWLRSNDLGSALDLMRKAERLSTSSSPAQKARGERLAEALSRAGSDKMFKKLTEMLLEGSDQSSVEAAEILKRGGSRSATYLIERLAEEENRSHRARLVMLLKEMGKGSSVPFVARLDDPRWFLVRNVVGILGDIGDPAVVPHLAKVASHADPRVRREVVRTIARFGTPECEEVIRSALRDEDRGVQLTAVNALTSLKEPRGKTALLEIAKRNAPFADLPAEVRQEAILSLGRMGIRDALPVLTEILTKKGFLGHAESADLRAAAARALGGLSSKDAEALLRELSQKDPRQSVREAAREALQERTAAATQRR